VAEKKQNCKSTYQIVKNNLRSGKRSSRMISTLKNLMLKSVLKFVKRFRTFKTKCKRAKSPNSILAVKSRN
jgi:hypothetical protein